jgi:dynein heavy chain
MNCFDAYFIESGPGKEERSCNSTPSGKSGVLFIEDLNMPDPDRYESQPRIELSRQLVFPADLYERPGLGWNNTRNVAFLVAGGPDGGSRAPITAAG